MKEKDKNVVVDEDLKGYIYNLDKLEESNDTVGENNLANRMFRIIKVITDKERKSIAEESELLMDAVTQIRKFLYDEEIKEMKNLQAKWKHEAQKEGFAEGIKSEKKFKLSIDEISEVTGLSKQEIQKFDSV